jgi:hypothetical protein
MLTQHPDRENRSTLLSGYHDQRGYPPPPPPMAHRDLGFGMGPLPPHPRSSFDLRRAWTSCCTQVWQEKHGEKLGTDRRSVMLGGKADGGFGGGSLAPDGFGTHRGIGERGERGRAGSDYGMEKTPQYNLTLTCLQEVGERDRAILWRGDTRVFCRQALRKMKSDAILAHCMCP